VDGSKKKSPDVGRVFTRVSETKRTFVFYKGRLKLLECQLAGHHELNLLCILMFVKQVGMPICTILRLYV
jgi:hypothetical protein